MKNIFFAVGLGTLIVLSCSSKKKEVTSSSESMVKSALELPLNDTIILPSGLRYKVISEGIGDMPKPTSRIRVHYHGTLDDGTVFDSSIQRGKPIVFGLNQVIKGWQEGLLLMRAGSVYELYIPPNLGYGASAKGKIPPFSHLNFRVELLEIL